MKTEGIFVRLPGFMKIQKFRFYFRWEAKVSVAVRYIPRIFIAPVVRNGIEILRWRSAK